MAGRAEAGFGFSLVLSLPFFIFFLPKRMAALSVHMLQKPARTCPAIEKGFTRDYSLLQGINL